MKVRGWVSEERGDMESAPSQTLSQEYIAVLASVGEVIQAWTAEGRDVDCGRVEEVCWCRSLPHGS